MPLIVPCTVAYLEERPVDAVWIQVPRLASPLPPQKLGNHAQDCESLGIFLDLQFPNVEKGEFMFILGDL